MQIDALCLRQRLDGRSDEERLPVGEQRLGDPGVREDGDAARTENVRLQEHRLVRGISMHVMDAVMVIRFFF